jgi:hypothetical protein
VASARADATVAAGATVTLDGSASRDPDGSALTYSWLQLSGPPVTLATPDAAAAGFTAATQGTYTFELIVSDGSLASKDVVVVRVADVEVLFRDDFETARGWRPNPLRSDTATTGRWERAQPEATASGGDKQLGAPPSGSFELVTGAIAAGSAGANDVDGGVTSILSPVIAIPADGLATLSLSYYFAHRDDSSSADFFRVQVLGATTATVIEERGDASNRDAVFVRRSFDITAFAGQSVRILIETADLAGDSLVEAAVDDVVIEHQ